MATRRSVVLSSLGALTRRPRHRHRRSEKLRSPLVASSHNIATENGRMTPSQPRQKAWAVRARVRS
jgi:hypothetical protein